MDKLLNIQVKELRQLQIVDWAYTTELEAQTFKEYESWVSNGYHGDLGYLSDHRKDLRKNLQLFYPASKSVLIFLFDYTSAAKDNLEQNDSKLASYVKGFEGLDYHYWIKDKLKAIAKSLALAEDEYQLSIDAQPVLERDLAARAGLGWFGKNSMLINKEHGSFFIISSIILNKELALSFDNKIETDHCGSCSRCIDACPTNAILDNRTLDAKKCISHFTIEVFKESDRPVGFDDKQTEIFGCDICQNVCPWNQKPLKRAEGLKFESKLDFFKSDLKQIKSKLSVMSNREFRRYFKGTPLERTGRVGLLKNIQVTD